MVPRLSSHRNPPAAVCDERHAASTFGPVRPDTTSRILRRMIIDARSGRFRLTALPSLR